MRLSRIVFASILLAAVATAQNVPAAKPSVHLRSSALKKQLTPVASGNPQTSEKTAVRRRRDPFISMIRKPNPAGHAAVAAPICTTGKKCLAVNHIVLKGIAQGPDGMLALVENPERKSYLLRENDRVLNGEVVRITRDSVVFRQRTVSKPGRVVQHEVVMKLKLGRQA
jgi:hypothetical protein